MIDELRAKLVLEQMVKQGRSLGSAESLTAGLFASSICSIPGASRVFKGAVVSYAEEVKEHLLGVSPKTIAEKGVVSKAVAQAMALGALKALNVDVAVSFTGNAGPTAEIGEAPVGRVDMAVAIKQPTGAPQVLVYEQDFKGERNSIREACVNFMAKCDYRSLPDQKLAAGRLASTPRLVDEREVPENLKIFAKGRSYFIRTYGCQANIRDEEVFAGYLEKAGFVRAESCETANVVVINTCAVRENAEDKIYGEIGLCKANKDKDPDFLLILAGCVMGENGVAEKLQKTYPYISLIIGTHGEDSAIANR